MDKHVLEKIRVLEQENQELHQHTRALAQELIDLKKELTKFGKATNKALLQLERALTRHAHGLNAIPGVFNLINSRLNAVEGHFFEKPLVSKDPPN